MDRTAPDLGYEAPFTKLDLSEAAALPSLPDATEARCWVLSVGEGMSQQKIAAELGMSQGTVSRAIVRAEDKINDFVRRGLTTRERLIAELRRGIGLAPRT